MCQRLRALFSDCNTVVKGIDLRDLNSIAPGDVVFFYPPRRDNSIAPSYKAMPGLVINRKNSPLGDSLFVLPICHAENHHSNNNSDQQIVSDSRQLLAMGLKDKCSVIFLDAREILCDDEFVCRRGGEYVQGHVVPHLWDVLQRRAENKPEDEKLGAGLDRSTRRMLVNGGCPSARVFN